MKPSDHELNQFARIRKPSVWEDPKAYDRKAEELAAMFKRNFEQSDFDVPSEVRAAGPAV
jgi:ATP-dependent phosphoenolpyruvate carboxykinase